MAEWIAVERPKLKRDYVGRTVRTKHTMMNAGMEIPRGTIATVKYRPRTGAVLAREPCTCCGITMYISQVQDHDFEFVEEAK